MSFIEWVATLTALAFGYIIARAEIVDFNAKENQKPGLDRDAGDPD